MGKRTGQDGAVWSGELGRCQSGLFDEVLACGTALLLQPRKRRKKKRKDLFGPSSFLHMFSAVGGGGWRAL